MDVFSTKEPEKYAQVRENPIINEIKEISISRGGSSVSKALISTGYTYSLFHKPLRMILMPFPCAVNNLFDIRMLWIPSDHFFRFIARCD